jgi:hypothetical protein
MAKIKFSQLSMFVQDIAKLKTNPQWEISQCYEKKLPEIKEIVDREMKILQDKYFKDLMTNSQKYVKAFFFAPPTRNEKGEPQGQGQTQYQYEKESDYYDQMKEQGKIMEEHNKSINLLGNKEFDIDPMVTKEMPPWQLFPIENRKSYYGIILEPEKSGDGESHSEMKVVKDEQKKNKK